MQVRTTTVVSGYHPHLLIQSLQKEMISKGLSAEVCQDSHALGTLRKSFRESFSNMKSTLKKRVSCSHVFLPCLQMVTHSVHNHYVNKLNGNKMPLEQLCMHLFGKSANIPTGTLIRAAVLVSEDDELLCSSSHLTVDCTTT